MGGGVSVNKESLRQYQDLYAEINELKQQRQEILNSLGAIPVSTDPVKSKGHISDPTAKAATKLAELQRLIDEKKALCLEQCAEIEKAINSLPARERRIMRLRYIRGLSWPRVTESIYGKRGDYFERYDSYLRTIHNYHGRALSKICV
jgi:hypothetical protein